ncbi:MAG TPA: glycosyltransferase family 39 protein, partial [Thermoanaerobaculia bacterium]
MIVLFSLAKLVLHLLTAHGYGYFRDELYYLACTEHLAAGYVDHPALSIVVLWLVRHTLGTSLLALRLVPTLAGAATVALVGAMARQMGGGRLAQALAMTGALVAGSFLSLDFFYSMNALDLLLWAWAAYLIVRLCETGGEGARLWLLLGLALGLGLANKISVLWLGAGLATGLVVLPERRWLKTLGPWLASTLALLGGLPYLLWNAANGWPTREFIHNATTQKMVAVSFVAFVRGQIESMNPFTLPLWLAGLAFLFFQPLGKRFRLLGV